MTVRYTYKVSDWCGDAPMLYRAEVVRAFGKDRVKLRHSDESGTGWRYRSIIGVDEVHDTPLAAIKAFKKEEREHIKRLRYDLSVALRNLSLTPQRTFE